MRDNDNSFRDGESRFSMTGKQSGRISKNMLSSSIAWQWLAEIPVRVAHAEVTRFPEYYRALWIHSFELSPGVCMDCQTTWN